MRWILTLFLVCVLCSASAAFMAWYFFYLAQGIRPLIIDEPNIWIARFELLFTVLIFILGFVGIYAITKVMKE